ncbi:MAG: hypothetical protein R6V56_08060, partial [Lentisphaeria bacterium]
MTRSEFIRITGGIATFTDCAPDHATGIASSIESEGVLLEASSFKRYGGWVLDMQFYQQTGGCYLLAHGMGKPVKNASAEVNIPTAGNWYIFVRTRDWCPGNWDAPGQFEVLLNGKPLDTVFGTEEGLAWQRGGKVKLPAGEIKVELHDLTGFEGRADAVYFSPVPDPELPVK